MSEEKRRGGDLFIVDNSDADWKVVDYLSEWSDLARQFDIATGSFEIGALLALDGRWQQLETLRILMGDEVTKRTRQALLAGVEQAKRVLDDSIETEKEKNDFLRGVPGVVEALQAGRILCRVYNKKKFHAKAFITHAKHAVIGPAALVGSSNFTGPGLSENVELNVQIQREVSDLQEWFDRHWRDAHDITEDILRVIERHTRVYTPFEVYAKALQEYFRGHEMTETEWEQSKSRMYPVLDQYQKEGYHSLLKIARQHNGAFLCDGVGLGKTFIGMMLIERLTVHDKKQVALFVPKAARKPVWESALKRYLPNISRRFGRLYIYNHTDLQRGGEWVEEFRELKETVDAIIIDEAHHFRNPGILGRGTRRPSRYRQMYDLAEGKQLFLLTATPINNSLRDLQHMIELFSRRETDYFKNTLGIHSLPGHFRKMEKRLEEVVAAKSGAESRADIDTNQAEAEDVLAQDQLFTELVVQRSRAYVRESQKQHDGGQAIFPDREPPRVVQYSIKKTYGRLLNELEQAFSKDKPLFSLAIYYPLAYYKGEDAQIDPLLENRQKQVVGLIRTQFLKRFESSAHAFQMSCQTLLLKLLAFAEKHSETMHERHRLERWRRQHEELLGYIHERQMELLGGEDEDEADADIITEEMLDDVEELPRDEYDVNEILQETMLDLDQVAEFLDELRKFKPAHDDKLKALVNLLKKDPVLKQHKVLIFSEYMATARYLKKQLEAAGLDAIDEVDSATKRDRGEILRQFSPYYNDSSAAELADEGLPETRILIATDVLSEGLNLQDATRLINYDLHWNPVRLMQRIGRVDRRMNPDIEARILAEHPDQAALRGKVAFWNFLPPNELDGILRLYSLVSHKTLRISKTFGIEGRQLLTPEDDYDALKDFLHKYEGTATPVEVLHNEYQQLLKDHPGLEDRLNALPGKVFSGKAHPSPGAKAVFFCFAIPALDMTRKAESGGEDVWTEEAGTTRWLLYDLESERILEEPGEIAQFIRSTPETPRRRAIPDETLADIRAKMEKHVKNTYLKERQAPVGVKATIKAWMELCS